MNAKLFIINKIKMAYKILIVVLIIVIVISLSLATGYIEYSYSPSWIYSVLLLGGAAIILFLLNKIKK